MTSHPKFLTDELPDKMLDAGAVLEMTGLSRSELYIAMGDDREFPRPIKVHRLKNGWFQSEVMAWLKKQPRIPRPKGRTPRKDGKGLQAVRQAQLEKEAATNASA